MTDFVDEPFHIYMMCWVQQKLMRDNAGPGKTSKNETQSLLKWVKSFMIFFTHEPQCVTRVTNIGDETQSVATLINNTLVRMTSW